jgi:type IV pilus assembly protein PilP
MNVRTPIQMNLRRIVVAAIVMSVVWWAAPVWAQEESDGSNLSKYVDVTEKTRELEEKWLQGTRRYVFVPEGKPDPFKPIRTFLEAMSASVESEAPLPPLQRLDLNQINLVAIANTPNNAWALVEDSTGTGYIIGVDTKIGRNGGRVTAILDNRIEIVEEYQNYRDQTRTRIIEKKLPQQDEGDQS